MITVFFESKSHAEEVATYETERDYMAALPELEKRAAAANMVVTESVQDKREADMVVNKLDSVGNSQPIEKRNAWGYPDGDTLQLSPNQTQALRRVIAQYMPDEQRHWEESGEPADHVYYDLLVLRWAIRQHDRPNTKGKDNG